MSVKVVCGEKCSEEDDVMVVYDRLIRSRPKAVLVEVEGREVWFPFSHIVAHDEGEQELTVTRWFANQEDLLE